MSTARALDPVSRFTEILFGLIMVLTFTCSLRTIEFGREDAREMLIGALGCNVAWGVIDAFFFLITIVTERGQENALVKKLRDLPNNEFAPHYLEGLLPESIIGAINAKSFSEIREHLLRNSLPANFSINLSDLRAAFTVFALVFLTIFPVALPFMFMEDVQLGLRVSNLIALVLLFSIGFSLGKYANRRPVLWGLSMTVIGACLVALTIALGG